MHNAAYELMEAIVVVITTHADHPILACWVGRVVAVLPRLSTAANYDPSLPPAPRSWTSSSPEPDRPRRWCCNSDTGFVTPPRRRARTTPGLARLPAPASTSSGPAARASTRLSASCPSAWPASSTAAWRPAPSTTRTPPGDTATKTSKTPL